MSDLPRNKNEILDLIFTFLNALCMSLAAIFLLSNVIVISIFVVVVVVFACVVLFLWKSRNPFNIYLVRAFAFNNLFFIFIALMIYYSLLSTIIAHPMGYALLLIPSVFYLIKSYKFSAVTTLSDKKEGAMLAYAGKTKASQQRLFRDNMEDRIKREELIAKQKKVYKYKLIIALAIILTLSSFAALIFGFS
ncbi:MAG: hypothetical protein KGD72_00005 [Candidatus Lokiarchaeota archaeon]|nr:hypothetical protein [Candidatus Lokiarchaeota archaeon]